MVGPCYDLGIMLGYQILGQASSLSSTAVWRNMSDTDGLSLPVTLIKYQDFLWPCHEIYADDQWGIFLARDSAEAWYRQTYERRGFVGKWIDIWGVEAFDPEHEIKPFLLVRFRGFARHVANNLYQIERPVLPESLFE